jgi:Protein of unknown function DUF262
MKLKGEIFDIKKIEKTLNQSISDEKINEKYLKGEIRIITEQARYPLDTIPAMLSGGKYELNPEYQRRKRWGIIQQSKLIESFIINVPIPPIFLYEVEYAKYEVMDGLQRLTAIDDFYNGKFALEGLEEWKELNGKTYNKLPSKIREGIDRRYLSSIVLLNETAKNKDDAEFLKQIVFGRLNSGGDKLTPQETRNALYGGPFNNYCIQLSKDKNFRELWCFPQYNISSDGKILNEDELLFSGDAYRAMEDVELVLRFFAFRHYEKLSSFKSQEKFIDEFLNQANNFEQATINSLGEIFKESAEVLNKIFGSEAFYMPDSTQKKTTPTKTVYDPLMQSISKILDKKAILLEKAEQIKAQKFQDKENLLIPGKEKNNELFDGKYNNKNNIESRIKYFDNFFATIINS